MEPLDSTILRELRARLARLDAFSAVDLGRLETVLMADGRPRTEAIVASLCLAGQAPDFGRDDSD